MSDALIQPWHIWFVMAIAGVVWTIFKPVKPSVIKTVFWFMPIIFMIARGRNEPYFPDDAAWDIIGGISVLAALFATPIAFGNLTALLIKKDDA